MGEINRRDALAAAAGLSALAAGVGVAADDKRAPKAPKEAADADRKRVIACGMTPEEADCWEAVAAAAGKFFALPELHPMDRQEVASAIHVVQNKLLSRPTYRRYIDMAKKGKTE